MTTSAGVHAGALTEFALLGLLMGAKDVRALDADRAERRWGGRRVMRQLADQTVLIVGLGGIGLTLADRLRAFGTRVIGVNRSGRGAERVDRLVTLDELPEVVGRVDAVVCCLPDSPGASGVLDSAFFAAACEGVTFVNVGRGTAVDEEALVAALRSGHVGFAALDVVAREPLAADSALFELDNVLLSPHTAALTDHEEERVARVFVENADRLLRGDELVNRMDVVAFY
ncbi:D-2-hydroxyacid dehydrogenase [Frigoribacterium sp. 2-23]|uniref:D-2-hydroxyacid dehydrogenase n=1 Tax=Frigoribacterium sp. 2-23 TaxID=3415006 RepID=UPI003C701AEE